MTPTQKAVEAAAMAIYEARNGKGCKPWSLQPKSHKEPYISDARAALTAALAVDGLCLVPSNILAELRKRDDTINQIGPRGEELTERVIANERANAWPIVSAMLAAASTGDPPRQEKP